MNKQHLYVMIEDMLHQPAYVRAFWHNAFIEKQDCLVFRHDNFVFHVLVRTDRKVLKIERVKHLLTVYNDLYLSGEGIAS